jgi:hypothetical protein
MNLTKRQSDACHALLEALALDKSSGLSWMEELEAEFVDYDIQGQDDLVLDEPLDDPDEDVEEDIRSLFCDDVPFHSNVDPDEKIAENRIQACLLELLISLYTHLPTGREDKFWSPILRFVVIFSLKKDGKWLNANQITQIFAALLFCGRLVMMVLMYRKVQSDPGVRYSAYVDFLSSLHVSHSSKNLRAYSSVERFLDDDHEGPIPTLYILMRPLNKFVSAEDGALQFTALNFNGDNIILSGQVLYLHNIRNFVELLITEIKDHIKRELLFNLDIVNIDWSPGIIHEEPRNTRISYSVFDDTNNPFHLRRNTVLEVILTDPRIRGRFHYVDQHNRIVWKAGPCFAYMDIAHKVEMKLFSATQTTVGEPGRGTEVASHLIRNVSGGTLRNIFVTFQHFVMMGTFNKNSSITERDETMIRASLPEVGRLWILYITFIRPILVIWQQYFNGPKAAARAKHCLFSGPHCAVTSSELSRSLSSHTERLLGIKISIGLWRHIVTWFMNHNCSRFQESLSLSGRSILAIQMGHSNKAHALYAADSRLPSGMDFHIFFQTMFASAFWHDLLGFTPTLLNSMKLHGPRIPQQAEAHVVAPRNATLPTAKDIAAEVMGIILPEMQRMHTQTRANDLASFLDVIGFDLQTSLSQPPAPPPTQVVHPSRIAALRRFLHDVGASFKHPQQGLAVELMANGNSSLLLVAPTGMTSISSTSLYSQVSKAQERHFLFCSASQSSTLARPQSWYYR